MRSSGTKIIRISHGRVLEAWAARPGAAQELATAMPTPDVELQKKLREHGYW